MRLNSQSIRGLVGFGFVVLFFIVLKLLGILTWSWFWVLSPLWATLLVSVFIVLVICVTAMFGKRK